MFNFRSRKRGEPRAAVRQMMRYLSCHVDRSTLPFTISNTMGTIDYQKAVRGNHLNRCDGRPHYSTIVIHFSHAARAVAVYQITRMRPALTVYHCWRGQLNHRRRFDRGRVWYIQQINTFHTRKAQKLQSPPIGSPQVMLDAPRNARGF